MGAMTKLGFGRFEHLRIVKGELVLVPGPVAVREVKLGSCDPGASKVLPDEFDLKPQVTDLFEHVRGTASGEIRTLVVRHGLPFSMEVAQAPGLAGGICD